MMVSQKKLFGINGDSLWPVNILIKHLPGRGKDAPHLQQHHTVKGLSTSQMRKDIHSSRKTPTPTQHNLKSQNPLKRKFKKNRRTLKLIKANFSAEVLFLNF